MSSSTRPTMSSTPRLTTVLNPSESSSRSSYRDPDGPSPTKKRKLSRPPSRAPSKTPARSRNSTPSNNSGLNVGEIADLHLARRTSSLKVLQTWSQLAEKYSKALDEDDIVDLRSLTLHKDRGVVFGDKRKAWDIGCFADASRDEDEENTVLDDDDDVDELDAFASSSRPASDEEGSEADDIEITQQSRRIPPVQEMDPEDANDLKEFLEMEEARRALYGDLDAEETSEPAEFDTSEDEYDSNTMESYIPADASLDSSRSRKEYYVDIDHDGSLVQHSDSLPDEDLKRSNSSRKLTSPPIDIRPRHETHLPTPASESESDDELAGWGTDEENEVPVADKLPAARSLMKTKPPSTGSKASAIRKQIPDLTHVLKRASSQGPRKQPRTLTPPSTEFSSHHHPSRTISKMPAPRKEESDAYTVPSSNIRRTKAIRAVTQLATPPLSSSSVTDSELVHSTARHRQGFGVAGSSITGPVTNPPPKASSSRFDRSRPQPLTRSLSESPTKISNVHMIPEVVIYRRTPSLDSKSVEPLNRRKAVSSVEVQEGSSSSFKSPSRLPQSRSSSKTLGSTPIPNEKGKQRADEPLEHTSVPEQKRRRSSSSYHYSDSQFDHDVHLDYSFKQSPNKSRARSQSRIDKSPIREHQYPERYPSVATHPQQLNPQLPLVPLPTLPQFPPLDLNDHATTSQYLQAHYQIAAHAMHSISVLMGSRNGLTNPSLGLPAYDPSVYSPPSSSPIRSTPHKYHANPGYPSYSESGSSPDPPPRSSSFSPERWRDSSPSPGSPKERSRPYSIDPTGIRPRSAMRSSSRSSKTSTPRKVSFSSPEVVQIDGRRRTSTRSDQSREISEEVILVTSDSEDDRSDHNQSNSITRGRSRYSLRAQTPGPPSRKISR